MADPQTCSVCGEVEADPALLSDCFGCWQLFHLNPYNTPGKDCGDAWVGGPEGQTLQFMCNPCITRDVEEQGGAAAVGSPPGVAFPPGFDPTAASAVGASPPAPERASGPPPLVPREPSRRRYRRVDR